MDFRTLDDIHLNARKVLVRVDINVPVQDGKVTDLTRMERIARTIRDILAKGGKPVLLSHFGRPKGRVVPEMSLAPLVPDLESTLGAPVRFSGDCVGRLALDAVADLAAGEVLLLENTRFHAGEEANDAAFAGALAELGDIYCNDAFSASHRAHASTEALARLLPNCAGRLMQAELEALQAALGSPARPVVAIVGGAKVSTKLTLLGNLLDKVDVLVIGGGMANTFLAAQGHEVGRSLCEHDLVETAREIAEKADGSKCRIVLPVDAVVASELTARTRTEIVPVSSCPPEQMILDAGPASIARIAATLSESCTLVWNGPLGAFETPPFNAATDAIARQASSLTRAGSLVSIAGGGDTVSALNRTGSTEALTYVSTAGGAFLEWMEGRELPGVAALACH